MVDMIITALVCSDCTIHCKHEQQRRRRRIAVGCNRPTAIRSTIVFYYEKDLSSRLYLSISIHRSLASSREPPLRLHSTRVFLLCLCARHSSAPLCKSSCLVGIKETERKKERNRNQRDSMQIRTIVCVCLR